MPHCIVEYSANLTAEADIPGLLAKLSAQYHSAPAVFPPAGIRVRAWPVTEYLIADNQPEHGFVNITYRIGAGRDRAFVQAHFARAFALTEAHFADLMARRGIGLTQYVEIAEPDLSWKANSIGRFLSAPARAGQAGPVSPATGPESGNRSPARSR